MLAPNRAPSSSKRSFEGTRKLERPRPFRWRFGLGRLMLAMTVCCITGVGLSYLSMALRGQRAMRLVFILFSVAGPVLVLVIFSLLTQLADWWKHR